MHFDRLSEDYSNDALPGAYKTIQSIGNITTTSWLTYSYGDFDATLFYGDDTINTNVVASGGDPNFFSRTLIVNKNLYQQYDKLYLYGMTESFPEAENFQYETYSISSDAGILSNSVYRQIAESGNKLAEGEVSGSDLNNGLTPFQLKYIDSSESPTFVVVLKHNDEVVYLACMPIIYTANDKTLTAINFRTKENAIYMNLGHGFKSATNSDLEATIQGYGFNDDETYSLKITDTIIRSYTIENAFGAYTKTEREPTEKIIQLTGKQLNDGSATVTVPHATDDTNLSQRMLSATVIIDDNSDEDYLSGRTISDSVTIVKSSNFFSDQSPYNFDLASDYIRGVNKRTSIDDFVLGINISNDNSVVVVDSEGNEVTSGNVGTGMTIRIKDKFSRPILDLSAVVTGDLDGDGDIGLVDLVRIGRHISNKERQTGVYESAGDITGSGSIELTDLVRIGRDIAGLEEIK